jgi:hypothetical protein
MNGITGRNAANANGNERSALKEIQTDKWGSPSQVCAKPPYGHIWSDWQVFKAFK